MHPEVRDVEKVTAICGMFLKPEDEVAKDDSHASCHGKDTDSSG